MTTVISRVYKDAATASGVTDALAEAGFPAATYETIGENGGAEAIAAARVPQENVAAYAAVVKGGATMVVVRAPVVPFGAARKAMEIVNAAPALEVAVAKQDVHVTETAKRDLYIGMSILKDHPRWFSGDIKPGSGKRPALMSEVFYWPLLTSRRRSNSAMRGGGFISTKIIKYPLLSSRRPNANAVFPGGKRWLYNP